MVDQNDSLRVLSTLDATRSKDSTRPARAKSVPETHEAYCV
jgi:hypothetical protein